MRHFVGLAAIVLLVAAAPVQAQGDVAESLANWQWFQELRLPQEPAKYHAIVVPPAVFDQAQHELQDLRIADSKGKPIPYALFVRTPIQEDRPVQFEQFSEGAVDQASTVRLELKADGPLEHNALQIITAGRNFRRRVILEGKQKDDEQWSTVLSGKENYLVHFEVDGKEIRSNTLSYETSRLPILRVRVVADMSKDEKQAPTIEQLKVLRQVNVPGEYVTQAAQVEEREPTRDELGPASAWLIDLGHRVPVSQLLIDVKESGFARPFRIESIVGDDFHSVLDRGELERRAGDEQSPLRITFPEVFTRKLRLVVADAANPPLHLTSVKYQAALRELLFTVPPEAEQPQRLYYGNPRALAPRYDFASNLPYHPQPKPVRVELADPSRNPLYQPPPQVWSERHPWLIYIVLSVSSLALLGMLWLVARESLRQQQKPTAQTEGS